MFAEDVLPISFSNEEESKVDAFDNVFSADDVEVDMAS